MILNGATIIDGPELVWADDFGETWGGKKDSEGYSCRDWYTRDQYVNPTLNFFSKIVDGTYRIPTRQEVIDRTQFVVIQDIASGSDHDKYSTYPTLFEGLPDSAKFKTPQRVSKKSESSHYIFRKQGGVYEREQ